MCVCVWIGKDMVTAKVFIFMHVFSCLIAPYPNLSPVWQISRMMFNLVNSVSSFLLVVFNCCFSAREELKHFWATSKGKDKVWCHDSKVKWSESSWPWELLLGLEMRSELVLALKIVMTGIVKIYDLVYSKYLEGQIWNKRPKDSWSIRIHGYSVADGFRKYGIQWS